MTVVSAPSGGTSTLAVQRMALRTSLRKFGVAPVLVEVGAGEAEATAAVGPLDRPGEDLLAPLGLDDVLVRPAR